MREYSNYYGEHLHIGYHMPARYDAAFAQQLAKWFDEGIGEHDGEDATLALSEDKSWKITGCIRGDASGESLAAYLGKSEPNTDLDQLIATVSRTPSTLPRKAGVLASGGQLWKR